MKKKILFCLLAIGVLTTGITQALATANPCFSECHQQYVDCREIYGSTNFCWNEFEQCLDDCY